MCSHGAAGYGNGGLPVPDFIVKPFSRRGQSRHCRKPLVTGTAEIWILGGVYMVMKYCLKRSC